MLNFIKHEKGLGSDDITIRKQWPAYTPDLNQIKYV